MHVSFVAEEAKRVIVVVLGGGGGRVIINNLLNIMEVLSNGLFPN